MGKQIFQPGDPVILKKGKERGYEAYVGDYTRMPGTVLVHVNWDGDGVWWDVDPKYLTKISMGKLSTSMRLDAMKLRQKAYVTQKDKHD